MINSWHVLLCFWLTPSFFAEDVDKCSINVQPTSTVVVVGERVSLNCTVTNGDFSIFSWQIVANIKNKTGIYTAPIYGRNGTVITKKYVADGYSVTNTTDKTISLHRNQINISQSGLYVCQCNDRFRSIATTSVVVLASEPKFSAISMIENGKPAIVSCNISFNGSADISSNLTIKDVSGTTVNRTVCYSNNRLTSCTLVFTTTADPSLDQSFACSVHLISYSSIIYSRIDYTSLEWQRVPRAEIVMSNPSKCFSGKCVVSESITCKTDGNHGTAVYTWWQIQCNGSKLEIGDDSQNLVLTEMGQFTYQCQVYSTIRGIIYNATSKAFTIDVVTGRGGNECQILAFPIALAVASVIIAILTVTIIVLCRQLRQRNVSDAKKISTQAYLSV